MGRGKIAFVVNRYALNISGGGEFETRMLAEHLSSVYDVEVMTSCANDYTTWENYYDEEITQINGVTVRRFPTAKARNNRRLDEAARRMQKGIEGAEQEWIEEIGPYCPSLIDFLRVHSEEYKAIFFMTYSFYTTVMGMKLGLKNAVLIPTAHDENNIYKPIYKDVIESAPAFLFNSYEEKAFLEEKFDAKGKLSRTTCMGLDIPEYEDWTLPEKYAQYDNYVVYTGRVTRRKNFRQLNKYFMEYKRKHDTDLKLLVLGHVDNAMQLIHHKDIIYLGFVTEEEKAKLLKNAKFLIMPSLYESLSIVILESMMLGRPVLVNGECPVLKGQCIRSNAGLYYDNYAEFEKAMEYLLTNTQSYEQLCQNAVRFVKENYSWDFVVKNVGSLIEEISCEM